MMKVYGIKNCNKIRDTRAWLDEQGVDYEFVDVKKDPITDQKLADFAHKVGVEVLVNKRGMTWRRLGLSDQDPDEQKLFDLLLEHQTMIKRPLIEKDEAVLVGFDEDALHDFIS
ncbi:MAG: arsenate reductase family protein [Balneolaceae bacterium]